MWTSTKESLPANGQRVLCWKDYPLIGKAWQGHDLYYYRDGVGFVDNPTDDDPYGCITHWMPLPEGPVKEQ